LTTTQSRTARHCARMQMNELAQKDTYSETCENIGARSFTETYHSFHTTHHNTIAPVTLLINSK